MKGQAKPAVCHSQRTIAYNVVMLSKTLVVPFARAPQALGRDLLSRLSMPSLAKLLARARQDQHHHTDVFDACLPHERWLCGHQSDNSPALAHPLMAALRLPRLVGSWFILQPVHIHIARDHLVLTDYRRLLLEDHESRTLFDSIQSLFAEHHEPPLQLIYGNASYWFVRADAWSAFRTCTPDAACGHNIDLWQPSGDLARAWRRLHNDIQMLWHHHPLNDERESRAALRVNALWLWGMSSLAEPSLDSDDLTQTGQRLLAQSLVGSRLMGADHPTHALITSLLPPALAEDWSGWLQYLQLLEQEHFAPSLEALVLGVIDELSLVLSDGQQLDIWRARRADMRKFWVLPSLSRLAS